MLNLFYRRPRVTVLVIGLILVAGLSSYAVLPRMEDPLLTERAAMVNTRFPGADAERVEALVTEKLEEELQEIDEIKEVRSVSRAGISTINIELRDDVYEVDSVWSRVRDKLDDATAGLPEGVLEPEFEQLDVKAYALIVALTWKHESDNPAPNFTILRRLAEQLDDVMTTVPGTEQVDTFGAPDEEILVEVDVSKLSALGLTVQDIARQIRASDSKASAGLLRGSTDLLVEVEGELDSLDRIGQTPVQYSNDGQFILLSDVASIRRAITEPASSLAIVDGRAAIAVGVMVRPAVRVDHWSAAATETLKDFESTLPRGISLRTVFRQNEYVATRLASLLQNLIFGGLAVAVVIFFMMGWRSAIIVSSALPLSALMVLSGMRFLGIPIHQMSVTGLIVALGLLIDNAIVIVDEVSVKLRAGQPPADAVAQSVRHLAVPLLGSTLTTAFAFGPIALMPGPAGEFVGSIAVSVILAIFSSFFLALTIVPALTAFGTHTRSDSSTHRNHWFREGFSSPDLTRVFRGTLDFVFHRPVLGIGLSLLLPMAGFIQARHLPEQFFPPADRDQIQIEVDLPAQTSLEQTRQIVHDMRLRLQQHDQVQAVTWFVGESAPSFYYNLIPRRRNTSHYAQALVQLKSQDNTLELVHDLQQELDTAFAGARVLVRQLEQGPPFDAPVEVRLYGPDLSRLRSLGDQVRATLREVPDVIHTRSDLGESVAKLSFHILEEEARLAGLDYSAIASQLNDSLEGAVGGSVLEATEELPVRVRVSNSDRADLSAIASLELTGRPRAGAASGNPDDFNGIPLSALSTATMVPEPSAITRLNSRRMNEVQAYLKAGVLPAVAQRKFTDKMTAAGLQLPPGYSMEFGGESAERDDAVGNLMASAGVLLVLMIATLVLSFSSFRMAAIIAAVAALAAGLGMGALWVFGHPFGFMAIVGTMGLIGVAINDSIVVLAAIREDQSARTGNPAAVRDVVLRSSRHVVATTLTTIAGFIPLLAGGGGFWPPLATAIAGGVGGATTLALYFAPSAYILLMCRETAPFRVLRVFRGRRHRDGISFSV